MMGKKGKSDMSRCLIVKVERGESRGKLNQRRKIHGEEVGEEESLRLVKRKKNIDVGGESNFEGGKMKPDGKRENNRWPLRDT